ncbi:PAS domain-containing sensor histidine kinase [Salidesulfovibrio brasiliensis]|uniref:PAS domain-containing sensor histidine kinase n=1 Tax=Salidesulfovibrio brasiliensis TaxID=221711 RepID=UPI0006D0E8DE|nr:PAS domain-containing sensor histidine kinase [Salidesulfovibrio brasiliensis]
MKQFTSPTQGTALSCSPDGSILNVVSDGLGVFSHSSPVRDLNELVDEGSHEKLSLFLRHVHEESMAMGWEIAVRTRSTISTLFFFGVMQSDHVFIVISQPPETIISLYEQMLSIVNEQGVMLRQCQQALNAPHKSCADEEDLDSFMRLNNELINAQRELTLRNRMLTEEQERTRQLFELNPDALLVLSEGGEVITFNTAARKLFGNEITQTPESMRFKVPEAGESSIELCIPCESGKRVVECRSMEMEWERKKALLVSLRDITERKELDQLKEDVDRIARHDLKSPVGGILSLSRYLADQTEGDVSECASLIAQTSGTIMDMIDDSLSLYSMECGTYELKPEPVAMKKVVDQILVDNQVVSSAKNLDMAVHLDGEDLTFPGESTLYRSMLSNIVKNAVEAAPEQSTVTIRAQASDQDMVLTVHNYGAVPEPIRQTFFEKYATHGKRHGNGLGTYSARLIATTLGGSLSMQTSEEHGTTLSFSLAPPSE